MSRMIIAEGPEDCTGKCGREIDRLLAQSGLPPRTEWFLTSLYRRRKAKDEEWTAEDLAAAESPLRDELRRVQPGLIVTLGRHATRFLVGDVDMEAVWGLAWDCGSYTVFPIHHPAAGLRNPELSPYVAAGFQRLAEPEAAVSDDPHAGVEQYEEITTEARLTEVLATLTSPIAVDTEGFPARPYSIQFSDRAGCGYLLRATRRDLLDAFGEHLLRSRARLTFHSALHDLGMLRALGLPTRLPFDDTMIMAYLLQLEPQGLKALAARHCGMAMNSYDDLISGPADRMARQWLEALLEQEQHEHITRQQVEFHRLITTPYTDSRGKIKPGRKLRTLPQLPKTPVHQAVIRCLRSADARKLWADQTPAVRAIGNSRFGRMPDATLDYVDPAAVTRYACRDADATQRVRAALEPRIRALGLQAVYELELATYPLIERMQYVGIKPDLAHFRRLSDRLAVELAVLQDNLVEQTGLSGFNANSGDQVSAYVFGQLGLPGGKKTSTGRYSTNDKILEALEKEHGLAYPVLSDIRRYREYFKLKSTFVDQLPAFVDRWPHDGRVHCSFRTTRVVTGRLAASDPNLLAMPKHGAFAADFRRGWVAEDGNLLAEWDLSQIELRVLAHLAQDPVLLEAFRAGKDLHAGLAQKIFGGVVADHKKGPTRLAAKAINFGIPMGMTAVGLSVELRKNGVNANEDDAQKWLDETMQLYTGVRAYQDSKAAEAASTGFVRCLSGRIRYIGGIGSHDDRTREEAKRFAFSTPIQEGAQWLMKQAEARVWTLIQEYWQHGRCVEPLIQVHDALTIECEEGLVQELHPRMVEIMTATPPGFSVPVETSGDAGPTWADMEPLT